MKNNIASFKSGGSAPVTLNLRFSKIMTVYPVSATFTKTSSLSHIHLAEILLNTILNTSRSHTQSIVIAFTMAVSGHPGE